MKMNLKTIILAEHNPGACRNQSGYLKKGGYSVITVDTPENVFEIIENDKCEINLVLIEIDAGGEINRIKAAEKVLMKYNIPVLFLSSEADPEVIKKLRSVSICDYIRKDADSLLLLDSVKMAIELHEIFTADNAGYPDNSVLPSGLLNQ